MALLHFYIPCALIMAFQFAQKIRGVIGRKIEMDIFCVQMILMWEMKKPQIALKISLI